MLEGWAVVVPWHREEQIERWVGEWIGAFPDGLEQGPSWLILQQDERGEGCARTKNTGIRRAIDGGFTHVLILDDDCFPAKGYPQTLDGMVDAHTFCLKAESLDSEFLELTKPPSRGTPHKRRSAPMEVAASMGYWSGFGDVDAATEVVLGHRLEGHVSGEAYGQYFPMCGMNLAFPLKWWPWCQFVDIPRYDDIWMGWLWQKRAYALGCCFSLDGPWVRHERQSNYWKNLLLEAPNMEANETLWDAIRRADTIDYDGLRKLLPGGRT